MSIEVIEDRVVIEVIEDNYVVDNLNYTSTSVVEIVDVGMQGPPGASSSELLIRSTSGPISALRVVRFNGEGVVYADCLTLGGVTSILGVSTTSTGIGGGEINIRNFGELQDNSFTFTLGLPILLGENGLLTQNAPTIGYSKIIGWPVSTNKIFIDPEKLIITI